MLQKYYLNLVLLALSSQVIYLTVSLIDGKVAYASVTNVINGTAGNDSLKGTELDDIMRGFEGDDSLADTYY